MHFGLADGDNTCMGLNNQQHVKTLDRCSLGSMPNQNFEYTIEKQFQQDCASKRTCSMELLPNKIFDRTCLREVVNRQRGRSKSGPPKVYATALCEQQSIQLFGIASLPISREAVSLLVVMIDILIMTLFMLAIFKLKWYERLTVRDVQRSMLRIEDFSVQLESIPVASDVYLDDADLLSAMLVPKIEDAVARELEKNGETPEDAKRLS